MSDRKSFIDSVCSHAKNNSKVVWCTDFDGTLSEYVPYQDEARPVDGAVDALFALRSSGLDIAVVSGRPVSYLRNMIGDDFPLYGSYGTESFIGGEYALTPIAQKALPMVEQFTQLMLGFLDEQGGKYDFSARVAHVTNAFFVEEKPISVSLNTQAGEHQKKLRHFIDDMFLELDPSQYGLIMEDYGEQILVHPIDFSLYTNKSQVLTKLRSVGEMVFCGDDASDIDAAAVTKANSGSVLVVDNQLPPPRKPTPEGLLELADYVCAPNGDKTPQADLVDLMNEVATELLAH